MTARLSREEEPNALNDGRAPNPSAKPAADFRGVHRF
jgi:hypothetical protein